LAPIGAYLAVTGKFDLIPVLYSVAVLLWVSGFDIIYALQDEEFDKSQNLFSIPTALGKKRALLLSSVLHAACVAIIYLAAWLVSQQFPAFGWLNWLAALLFTALVFYQHTLVNLTT
jgi:4-hydroxybenzoate polyprenyltransferase